MDYTQPPHTSYYIGSAALAKDAYGNKLNYIIPQTKYTNVVYPSTTTPPTISIDKNVPYATEKPTETTGTFNAYSRHNINTNGLTITGNDFKVFFRASENDDWVEASYNSNINITGDAVLKIGVIDIPDNAKYTVYGKISIFYGTTQKEISNLFAIKIQ